MTSPAAFATPYQMWAKGVEMQMAMFEAWMGYARIFNPFLPVADVQSMVRHSPAVVSAKRPSATVTKFPAAAQPARTDAPSRRGKREPAKLEQPFKA